MKTWEEMYCKAKSAAEAAGKKTCDMVESAKLKMDAAEAEKALCNLYESLGRLLFQAKVTGENKETEADQYIEKIKAQQDVLAQLQHSLDALKKGVRCNQCGTWNAEDSSFCKKCGHAL